MPSNAGVTIARMYFYIMASRSRTLYCGVSGNIEQRVRQHKEHIDPDSFTAKYNIERLVYFEHYATPMGAIRREKQIKNWSRAKKIWLIERENPTWADLAKAWGKPLDWVNLRKPKPQKVWGRG